MNTVKPEIKRHLFLIQSHIYSYYDQRLIIMILEILHKNRQEREIFHFFGESVCLCSQ